ncbi:MAG: ATP-binding protein [Bacteroidia bacterium]|nr:ATP-binding protein [Bacteroidia bacterium]
MSALTGKSLILLRGLPGSGKSSFAKLISENDTYPVFSVDDFFTSAESGTYRFDYMDNHKAYALCEKNTRESMHAGKKKIIVDNTFTMAWETEPYFRLAAEHGYSVYVLTVENYHGNKNVHGITEEQMKLMADKYRVKLM